MQMATTNHRNKRKKMSRGANKNYRSASCLNYRQKNVRLSHSIYKARAITINNQTGSLRTAYLYLMQFGFCATESFDGGNSKAVQWA